MKSTYAAAQTLTLPSGKKVLVRRPSVTSLLASGGFPTGLTSAALKILVEKRLEKPTAQEEAEDPESVQKWAAMLDSFLPRVLVQPKVGPQTDIAEDETGLLSGTIAVTDILDFDKQVIFYFGTGLYRSDEEIEASKAKEATVETLKPFPGGAERVDAGPGSEAVRAETVESGQPGG